MDRIGIILTAVGVVIALIALLFGDALLEKVNLLDPPLTRRVIGTWRGEMYNETTQSTTIMEIEVFKECEEGEICAHFDLDPICTGDFKLIGIDEDDDVLIFEAVNNSCVATSLGDSLKYISPQEIQFTARGVEFGTNQGVLYKVSD